MQQRHNRVLYLLPALLMVLFAGCATLPTQHPAEDLVAYIVRDEGTRLSRFAPVFVVEGRRTPHNLIGTPSAAQHDRTGERLFVNPFKATVYAEERPFTTPKDRYTNLIYRVHFEEIPGGISPYHLGKGKNVGVITVVTLNSRDEPILYTTVHTCGCYLAFVPTSLMPAESLPEGWERGRQTVYGESLPGMLEGPFADPVKTMVLFREDTHRVKNIWTAPEASLLNTLRVSAELKPLDALEALPLPQGGTTSFYETSGPRAGYVKGSHKPRERLFMSWWAFDWRIGEDKRLGRDKGDGLRFYTSIKPWAKEGSDMRDFTAFLRHWKWNL